MAHIARGTRVRLVRVWHDKDRTGGRDVRIDGTVASYTDFGDGTGALLLSDVPANMQGYWSAPSSDRDQTTTLDVL